MPGRKYSQANSSYRYGFNGKENDNEVKGEGNQQDYGMRIYDPRLGRFLSEDPLSKSFAMLTPYQFASNTPIAAIDLDGLEAKIVTTYSYKDAKGTLQKRVTEENVKNPFNLGKGVLNIAINYKNAAPSTEAAIIAKYTPQTFMSKASEISTWFGEGKNEFGFVLSGNSNGTSVNNGSDGVQFKENLDIGVLLKVMGAIRDVTDEKSTITEFMTNTKIKGWYNIIKSSMKIGEVLLPADGKDATVTPASLSVNIKQGTSNAVETTTQNSMPQIKTKAAGGTVRESVPDSIDVWKHDGDSTNGTQNMKRVVNPQGKKKGG